MRTAMGYCDSISPRGWNWSRLPKSKCNGRWIDSTIDHAKCLGSEPRLRYSSEKRCATPKQRQALHFEIESATSFTNVSSLPAFLTVLLIFSFFLSKCSSGTLLADTFFLKSFNFISISLCIGRANVRKKLHNERVKRYGLQGQSHYCKT